MPLAVAKIKREHIEGFVSELLEHRKPATAANRFRGLQQFFKWAIDEGEIKESPMAKMHPPKAPEQPVRGSFADPRPDRMLRLEVLLPTTASEGCLKLCPEWGQVTLSADAEYYRRRPTRSRRNPNLRAGEPRLYPVDWPGSRASSPERSS